MDFEYNFQPGTVEGAPTILVCHGTGGDENSLTWLGEALFPGAALLCPRGRILEHGAPRFFKRFAEGVFDLDDVKFQASKLADFVIESSVTHGFDPSRVFGIGYSNGANILSAMMLTRPESLMGAALFRAMVTLEHLDTPNLTGKRIFLSEGEFDPIVPVENAQRLAAQLRSFGASVTVYWHQGGHNLARTEIDAASDWLNQQGLGMLSA